MLVGQPRPTSVLEVDEDDPLVADEGEALAGRRPGRRLGLTDQPDPGAVPANDVQLVSDSVVLERDPLSVRGRLQTDGLEVGESHEARGRPTVGGSGVDRAAGGEEESLAVGRPRQEISVELVSDVPAHAGLNVDDNIAVLRRQHQPLAVRRPRCLARRVQPPKPDASPRTARRLEDGREGVTAACAVHHERLRPVPSPGDVCPIGRKMQAEPRQSAAVRANRVEGRAPSDRALKDDRPRGPPVTSASRCECRNEEHGHEAGAYHGRKL